MADENTNNTAATTTAPAPVQPASGGAPQPAGEFVSAEQIAAWKRSEEQARGAKAYYRAGVERGIKSPEDFARIQLAEADQPVANHDAIDPDALASLIESRIDTKYAMREHETLSRAEQKIVDSAVTSLVGEATGPVRELIADAAVGMMEKIRRDNLYPEGHPLRNERLAPVTQAVWDAKAQAKLQSYKQSLSGATLAAIGDAARKGIQTSAGSAGVSGSIPAPAPGAGFDREALVAFADQKIAQRSGAPITSAR